MLDRSRHYYTIGRNEENIKFKQDGEFYYNDGSPVKEVIQEVVETKAVQVKKTRKKRTTKKD
jgi:hypothetical protein